MKRVALLALLLLAACAAVPEQEKPTVEVTAITGQLAPPSGAPDLYCRAGGTGEALFGKMWGDFSDATFILHQGSYSSVAFIRRNGRDSVTMQALYDGGGQKMIFCPFSITRDPSQRVACTSLYTIETDLNDGIKRTFDIPNVVRGAMISCAYTPQHIKTLTPPIEGGL